MNTFDYIIAGGGCSGLSLAWHIIQHEALQYKSILIVDERLAPVNDRTWCFWSSDNIPEPVPIYRTWKQLHIRVGMLDKKTILDKLSYNCVRSGDYTEALLIDLKKYSNIHLHKGSIVEVVERNDDVAVHTDTGKFRAGLLFDCYSKPDLSKSEYPLLQHFLGWEIETKSDTFNTDCATFMDFGVRQPSAAAFMYTLPYSSKKALFEYTVFSRNVLEKKEYEDEIRRYLKKHFQVSDYNISRTEFGVIPMADRIFNKGTRRIIPLGMASGSPKASTGYSFSRIHRQAATMATSLAQGKPLVENTSPKKYRLFDLLLLHILDSDNDEYLSVFEALFRNNIFEDVLSFLDEKTGIAEDLRIMASVPPTPFLKAIAANFLKFGSV